jgi:AraC-like DNA-binding protein
LNHIGKDNDIIRNDDLELKTGYLSNLAKLFFEIHKIDSALFYIDLSNEIAVKNNFKMTLIENYLTLSKIAESKGNTKKAFHYFKIYSNLKDSVFNAKSFGDVMQLQHLYEVSKTNQQIEQLVLEQKIKEKTIHYQKIIQWIAFSLLLLISMVLLFIFSQKKQLNRAYKMLLRKNLEIMDIQENSSEKERKKDRKSTPLTDAAMEDILNRILMVMKDTPIICDPKFSIDKLAELVHSNQNYVSHVINSHLKKNFRSFLNDYRIREAQRIFSDPDITKYTIEFIASQVGFKSLSAFYNAFKDITGVSPTFYFKEIKKVQDKDNCD